MNQHPGQTTLQYYIQYLKVNRSDWGEPCGPQHTMLRALKYGELDGFASVSDALVWMKNIMSMSMTGLDKVRKARIVDNFGEVIITVDNE